MTTDTSAEALEYETNQAALRLGEIGLRGMCIEASKRLRKLWKSMEDARDAKDASCES